MSLPLFSCVILFVNETNYDDRFLLFCARAQKISFNTSLFEQSTNKTTQNKHGYCKQHHVHATRNIKISDFDLRNKHKRDNYHPYSDSRPNSAHHQHPRYNASVLHTIMPARGGPVWG